MDVLDQLARSTVKINCDNGSTGTGFFFHFKTSESTYVATIITNKHVIQDVNQISLVFSLNDYFSSADRTVRTHTIEYAGFQEHVKYHTDPDVDICAIIIKPIIDFQIKNSLSFMTAYLDMENVLPDEELEKLRFMEDVIMVGYPSGLHDTKNNFPLFRRGTTSSHPAVDFEGRPEFIVDMTITPGSSGSPVFLYNPDSYTDKNGNMFVGKQRLLFLGINKAVYTINNYGEILEIPTPTKLVTKSNIGINLGIIVKSKVLKDIEAQILKQIEEEVKLNEADNQRI